MQSPNRNNLLRELKNHLLFLKDAGYSEIPCKSELFPKSIPSHKTTKAKIIENDKKMKTLTQIKDELGDCTRCKLSKGRQNI